MNLTQFVILNLWLSLALSITSVNPISNCLGNCIGCSQYNPTSCLPLHNTTSNLLYPCVPFYNGPNCTSTVFSYYNLYKQNGPFVNWSLPSPPPAQTCKIFQPELNSSSKSFPAIGPFSIGLNATKTLQFSLSQAIQRIIVKITIAVSDAILFNSTSGVNQSTIQTIDQNGDTILETIQTTGTVNTTTGQISFLSLIVADQLNSNALIQVFNTFYSIKSSTNTSCGFVYQYQFIIDSSSQSSYFQQLLLNFHLSSKISKVNWYLMGFSVEAGCSGFTVDSASAKCSTCLSGFYPTYDPSGYLSGCNICNFNCSTCSSQSTCLLCQAYTTSSSNGRCLFPSSYNIYQQFNVITGSATSSNQSNFQTVTMSKGQVLNVGLNLPNSQSYFIKFYLIYSLKYANSLTNMNISVNAKPYTSLTTLNSYSSTLIDVNSGSSQMFLQQVKIDLMGQPSLSNFSLGIVGSSSVNQEFYISDLTLVQYQCVQNCLSCNFNTQQATTCTQCAPFFSLSQNCKSCANGYFLKNSASPICVKCYSNCKQCIGPTSYSCTDCLSNFGLSGLIFNETCIKCVYNMSTGASIDCSAVCPNNFTSAMVNSYQNCTVCFGEQNNKTMLSSQNCINCWINLGLASGICTPSSGIGFNFYANDLMGQPSSQLWTGSESLSPFNCTSDYINLYGISQKSNHNQSVPSNLVYTLSGLPSHTGLIMVINIFKIGYWITTPNTTNSTNMTIVISVSSPGYVGSNFNIPLTNAFGGNICGESGNEMIWALQANLMDHTGSQVTMTINSPDSGIYVRQLEVYLGNCPDCATVGLAYSIKYIPMYSDNNTQTGLDAWINFNHQVYFKNPINQSQSVTENAFANSFKFSINNQQIKNAQLRENNLDQDNNLKYFLPLYQSYINGTLTVNTSSADLVYTQDGSVSRQLVSSSQSVTIQRYTDATMDERRSISQLSSFFNFFTWFALIVMIVCVMLGVGVVFQQFSVMLQIIYLHIYITSALLPAAIKVPLSFATRMQHLNYFANISSIENNLFGDLLYPGHVIFKQFNIDVYFLRSFYPILIINAIFIGWFIILKICYFALSCFSQSNNKVIRFFRSIPQRPLSYFDQIWRYQFLATMWACFMQFTDFQATGGQVVSLIVCVAAFIVAIIWPIVATVYTYRSHFVVNINHFRYLYHDLYYLKISSVADQPKYYLYVLVRFCKIFAYAVFIALFISNTIIGPVILIFVNIIQGLIAYFLSIYRKGFYLFTRILQNSLLIIAAILCLVIFGFSTSESLDSVSYQNLGYGLSTVFVLMIINGLVRFLYLVYHKIYQWSIGTYDVGEVGEKEVFDNRGPIPIAESQRL